MSANATGSMPPPSAPSQNVHGVDQQMGSTPLGSSHGRANATKSALNGPDVTSSQTKKRKNGDDEGHTDDQVHDDDGQGHDDDGQGHDDDDQEDNARLTSEIWNHFKRKLVKGVWKAICHYCKKALSGHTRNGTTHLRNHHAKCPQRSNKDIRQTMLNSKVSLDGKATLAKHMFDHGEARKELASMIILHEYPLSIVEHSGFRRFTNTLQPLFKSVSRNTIKKDIIEIYDFEKVKSMSLLEASKSRIALTTDMWTSGNQKKGFMVVTAHFIDESWVLQNRIIRFAYIPHPHTADDLSQELIDTMVEWNITRKLSTVTVDNCSTNDLMLKIIEDKLSEEHLLLEGKLLHMRCAAHILNLVVKDGLDVIGGAIDKIRDSVAYWRATPKRIEEFEKMSRKLKVPTTKKFILDCRIRWNSTYMMLDVALCYKDVFPSMKLKDKKYVCLPSDEDWDLAQLICEKLKKFYQVSLFFSGTAYPTANEFFSNVCQLKLDLTKWLYEENAIITSMANGMLEKFNKYWLEVNGVMAVASFLDPRYKLKLVEYYFKDIYAPLGEQEVNSAIKSVSDFCFNLFVEYAKSKSTTKDRVVSKVSTTSGNIVDHLSQYDAFIGESAHATPEKSEFERYSNEKVKPRTPDFDVLAWWKVNARDYPTLDVIARDVLAIPVSTVASESAFSTSGRFVSPHRSRLHPKTLEALMCAQDWLHAQMKGSCSMGHVDCCKFYEDLEEDEEGIVGLT